MKGDDNMADYVMNEQIQILCHHKYFNDGKSALTMVHAPGLNIYYLSE